MRFLKREMRHRCGEMHCIPQIQFRQTVFHVYRFPQSCQHLWKTVFCGETTCEKGCQSALFGGFFGTTRSFSTASVKNPVKKPDLSEENKSLCPDAHSGIPWQRTVCRIYIQRTACGIVSVPRQMCAQSILRCTEQQQITCPPFCRIFACFPKNGSPRHFSICCRQSRGTNGIKAARKPCIGRAVAQHGGTGCQRVQIICGRITEYIIGKGLGQQPAPQIKHCCVCRLAARRSCPGIRSLYQTERTQGRIIRLAGAVQSVCPLEQNQGIALSDILGHLLRLCPWELYPAE